MLTTAQLNNHSSACKIQRYGPQIHPFFLCLFIIHLLYAMHLTCNYSHCRQPLHHHLHWHHTHCVILYNLILSRTWRVALTISRSTLIFSPCLIHNCHHNCHHPSHHPHQHHTHCVVLYNLPLSVTGIAALTIWRSMPYFSPSLIHDCPDYWYHPHYHSHWHCTCRVILYIILLHRSLWKLC